MNNYLQGNYKHPHHVSVGAVVLNEKNEVACHYFGEEMPKGYYEEHSLSDFYILMRETMDPNESLETALHRGVMEEFGIKAELVTYIGSIVSHHIHREVEIEKTTLYFMMKLVEIDESKRSKEDIEGFSKIEWQSIDFLIPKMKEQTKRFGRTDLDESKILETVKGQISFNSNPT